MKHVINIYEARRHLSRLVDEADRGADLVIARDGKPVARLCCIQPKAGKRKLGVLDGQFTIPDDFNSSLVLLTNDNVLAPYWNGVRPV